MKGIVFENKEFKVVSYEEPKEELQLAFKVSDQYPQEWFSMENGIDAHLYKPWGTGRAKPLTIDFKFREVVIESRRFSSFPSFTELLNVYFNLTSEEINLKYEAALKNEKSELEIVVKELKEEKTTLEKFMRESIDELTDLNNGLNKTLEKLKK